MNGEQHEQNDLNPQTAADIDEAQFEMEARASEPDDALELRAALTQCRQELQEAKNACLRAHADFDNFRKRMRAERDQEFSRGSDRVLSDLLPVVDDFERAMSSVNEKSTVESLKEGVDLIYRQFIGLLERYGITPMDVAGQPFDPKYHDAVARVATSAQPEHTIVGEIQRGYRKNGDIFRPAKVAVAVAPEEPIAE
jgi:molecular chaperone GrpE